MPLGDQQEPYDLIVVGRGAAAADYLLTLPAQYKKLGDSEPIPLTKMIIGEPDPWAKARGYVPGAYAENINQEKQVLKRRTGDSAPTKQGPQDRVEFARKTEEIIAAAVKKEDVKDGTVRAVSEVAKQHLSDRSTFKLDSSVGVFYGRKIVFATGAGIAGDNGHRDYHAVPEEVTKAWGAAPPDAVMDLDRFTRGIAEQPQMLAGKKVAVLGPTAGTDAVMTALTLKVGPQNLYWLMRGQASTAGFANVYRGQTADDRQKTAAAMQQAQQNTIPYAAGTLALSGGPSGVKVRCKRIGPDKDPLGGLPVQQAFEVDVDFFVYSIGQAAANTMTAPTQGAPAKILTGDLAQRLEPVYDVNQRQGGAPWEHVTAVQLEGSQSDEGLLIIGAASFQVASKMEHNFLQYEYDQLRTQLVHDYAGFEACAHAHFPELLADKKLKELSPLTREQCVQRRDALVLAWTRQVSTHLDGWVTLGAFSTGDKAKYVKAQVDVVTHLCYLFQQRCQAATYLFEKDAKGRGVQDLLKPSRTLPDSLSDCRLLAAINANVSALNASSPKHLQAKTELDPLDVGVRINANFLEDETELRCYIAAHYPDVTERAAADFIATVIRERRALGNMGFARPKIVELERILERLEREAKGLSTV